MKVLRQTGSWILSIWSRFGLLLNRVCSPVMLGIVYFVVLTPIALLYRLFNRKEQPRETSFVERNKLFTPLDFENPW